MLVLFVFCMHVGFWIMHVSTYLLTIKLTIYVLLQYYLTFTPICNNILHQEVVLHEQVLSRIYMYYLFRLCARCFLSKYFLLEFIFSSCSSQELLCKVLYDITTFEWRYSSGLKGQGKFG